VKEMKFSANLGFLFTEGSSLIDQYQLASSNGFKIVEHPFPSSSLDKNQLLKVKEENGIELILVNMEVDDDARFGCAALPGKEESFKFHLKNTIDFAKAFKCKKFVDILIKF
jgi:hydroxypyruvate isomerase